MIRLIHGNEPYRIREYVTMMKNGSYDDSCILEVNTFTEQEVGTLRSYGMLGNRLVILELDNLKGGMKELEGYIRHPNEDNDLLIVCHKVDARCKVYKTLKDADCVEILDKYTETQAAKLVFERLNKLNVTLTKTGWEKFMEYINYQSEDVNMFDILLEMDKLAFYVGDGGTITENEVMLIIEKRVSENVFQLANYLLKKEHEKLMEQAEVLEYSAGFSSIQTMGLLMRSFRLIAKSYVYDDVNLYGMFIPGYMTSELAVKCMEVINDTVQAVKLGTVSDKKALRVCISRLIPVLEQH